jgi:integrase/recombinase XerC
VSLLNASSLSHSFYAGRPFSLTHSARRIGSRCRAAPDHPDSVPPPIRLDAKTELADVDPFPVWFKQFLNDRQTRKPSAHTMKAYRQDFVAIATLVTEGNPAHLAVTDITKESMRTAFAGYARDHDAASIRRC